MSRFTPETVTASSPASPPERKALRTGLAGSLVFHLTALAALSVTGAFAVQQMRPAARAATNPNTPATREGHEQRTAQAKETLSKLTAALNRLEKIESQGKPAFEKALEEAAQRAPSEAVQRLTEATQAQKRVSEALKRGESPKPAQTAAVNNALERTKRVVSLLPKKTQEKVTPLVSETEKKQAEALKQAAALKQATALARQSAGQVAQASQAAKEAALQAQRDAEAAMAAALAQAKANAERAAGAASDTAQVAKADTGAKKPHPGEHKPSCFAPGGI